MTTQNMVNVGLSGATGSGNFVGSTSATLVTPTLGAATATTIAFNPTTGGNIGTTAADNASTGIVGQVLSTNIPYASAFSLTSGGTSGTSIILNVTAGDWDVSGNVYVYSSANALSQVLAGFAFSNGTLPSDNSYIGCPFSPVTDTAGIVAFNVPMIRVNSSSTTTVYLTALATFALGTATLCGNIYARRMR